MQDIDRKISDEFINRRKTKKVWRISDYYNDVVYRIPATNQAVANSKKNANTYMYYWIYPSTKKNLKACQGVELPFVLNGKNGTIFVDKFHQNGKSKHR